jgi:putative inorganic carbon (HCO3(-)) transporter
MTQAVRSPQNTMPAPGVRSGHGTSILHLLVAGYAILIPYLFTVGPQLNFAPADCCLALIVLLALGQLKYARSAWTGWHVALLLTFALGSFISVWRTGELSRYELMNKDAGLLLLFLAYAAITSAVMDWGELRRILRAFMISVVLLNVAGVAAFLAGFFFGVSTPLTSYGGTRLSGMMLDANAYGGLLVVALVLCEGASWGPAPLFRGFPLLFCRLTLALGILFSFSRSAWIALGLALAVLCVVRSSVAIRLALVASIGAPCLVLLMGNRFLPFFERMASRPQQVEGRFTLIHDALAAFVQHPFLGGGLGNFRIEEGNVMHNSALWFLADFGLAGLVVLAGFLGWFFVRAWNAYRLAPEEEKPVALALLLAHTAMLGLAMGIEAFYQREWWLVMALIGSSNCLVRDAEDRLRPTITGVSPVYEVTI